tara:strand:+ start:6873 stop:7568 length:696 start_codon:yes stop_codon:yes gene_type:complete
MVNDSFLTVAVLPIPNMVFFPNTDLPLYMADPRHIQMVQDCIASGRLMAVSLMDITSGHTRLRNSPRAICTVGEPVVLSENEDGSIKVLLRSHFRVKLLTLKQSLPYMLYTAENIPDQRCESDFNQDFGLGKLHSLLKRWAKENIDDSSERENFLNKITNAKEIVDAVSMYMVVDSEIRQLLLENVHLSERVQMLATLFSNNFQSEDIHIAEALKRFESIDKEELSRKIAH